MLTATCDCGAALHAIPARPDDWQWVDADGLSLIDTSPPGYREDPRGWWQQLAQADIAAYSALSARAHLGMLGWTHGHRPAHQEPYPGDVPSCCGMPMRLVPRGWVCRETTSHSRAMIAHMVTVTGTINGRQVQAEVHGPDDVRGDSDLVTVAAGLVRRGTIVHAGPVLGGGPASFEDDRIATATLLEALDPGTGRFEGLDLTAPDQAIL